MSSASGRPNEASARSHAPLPVLAAGALGSVVFATLAVSVGSPSVARAALGLGAALIAAEWARRLLAAIRSGRATALVATGMLVALSVAFALWVGNVVLTLPYAWVVLFVEAGGVLLWAAARAWTSDTPWQSLSRRGVLERTEVLFAVAGALAWLVAAWIATSSWSELRSFYPSRALAAAGAVGLVAAAVAAALFWRALRRPAAGAMPAARHASEVAAHLHDSVLQTLALINRNADDPARVQQLARQQERSLRAWLAGRDEAAADTLAGAVRVAAQEVEDEEPGARVEVVAVGDAPFDRAADAMVRAAREAMRNAVRHAGSPVRVFVEVEGAVREVFIRDTGKGFQLAEVAEERRGVRDAIIGRMEHVGGGATIDSGSGGTEIALRYDGSGSEDR